MKTMATQLSLLFRLGQRKSNVRLLIKFACVLVFFFVLYSVLFHMLMLLERAAEEGWEVWLGYENLAPHGEAAILGWACALNLFTNDPADHRHGDAEEVGLDCAPLAVARAILAMLEDQ